MDVRLQLAETFGIHRSQGTHVQDNVVISDGYSHEDLARINVGTMQVYLNSKETDFFVLFNQVLDELPVLHSETELIPAATPEVKVTIEVDGRKFTAAEIASMPKPDDTTTYMVAAEAPKKRGRPAKTK